MGPGKFSVWITLVVRVVVTVKVKFRRLRLAVEEDSENEIIKAAVWGRDRHITLPTSLNCSEVMESFPAWQSMSNTISILAVRPVPTLSWSSCIFACSCASRSAI